jgi:5'-nucleotidase
MERADLVLLNSGGLRSDLPAGALTFGALYEVFPFDNTIATLQLTGGEFLAILEALLSSSHGAPQISGLKIDVLRCPKQSRILSATLPDGRPFDRAATYRVTTSDFLALGGDGVGRVLEKVGAERKDFGHRRPLNMRDALAAWLEKQGGTLEAELDGRLRFADAKACDGTQSPPPSP